MHITFDPEVNAGYIKFGRKRAQVRTIVVTDDLNVDIDGQGRVYGIELLDVNKQFPGKRFKSMVVENQRTGKTAKIRLQV